MNHARAKYDGVFTKIGNFDDMKNCVPERKFLDDGSLWTRCPLDNASLGQSIPDDVSHMSCVTPRQGILSPRARINKGSVIQVLF